MSSKLSSYDVDASHCNVEQISNNNNIIHNAFDVIDIDAVAIKNQCVFNGKFADTFMDDDCDNVGLDLDILVDHSMVLKCKNITTSEYCNYIHKNVICRSVKKNKMFVDYVKSTNF
jgi:hypothetical protein